MAFLHIGHFFCSRIACFMQPPQNIWPQVVECGPLVLTESMHIGQMSEVPLDSFKVSLTSRAATAPAAPFSLLRLRSSTQSSSKTITGALVTVRETKMTSSSSIVSSIVMTPCRCDSFTCVASRSIVSRWGSTMKTDSSMFGRASVSRSRRTVSAEEVEECDEADSVVALCARSKLCPLVVTSISQTARTYKCCPRTLRW